MSDHTADPLIGAVIGDYRIEGLFGAGAMGRVYRATRLRLGQQVALKVLEPYLANDVDFRTRFEREWRLAASLNHPNVVPIYDAGEVDGQLYLAMLPVDGGDLGQLIKGGPLAARRALAILGQVANALDAAHARGLVHRDVKPGNILLAAGLAGEGDEHVYLADFGLTKHAGSQSRLTRVGVFVGTYAYAAPEQFGSGAVGPPADIYALGCVLYECLTGHVPFETDSDAALMRAHLYEPLPSLRAYRPELPIALDIAIARATAKDPAMRYATARAFIADARAALAGGSIDNPARAVFDLPPTIVRPPADAPLAPPGSQPPPPSSTWGQPQTGWGQPPAPPGWGQPPAPPAPSSSRTLVYVAGAAGLAVLLAGGAMLALNTGRPPTAAPTSAAQATTPGPSDHGTGVTPPPTPTPTPSRRPRPSVAPPGPLTEVGDLLFLDDMDPGTGWGLGELDGASVENTEGKLRISIVTSGKHVWSPTVFDEDYGALAVVGRYVISGESGIGSTCTAPNQEELGAEITSNGGLSFFSIKDSAIEVLMEVANLPIALRPGELIDFRLDCAGMSTGAVRLIATMAGYGTLGVYESDIGPETFHGVSMMGHSLGPPVVIDVDQAAVYGLHNSAQGRTPEGDALVARVPVDWQPECIEGPSTNSAIAVVSCFPSPGGIGPELTIYEQFEANPEMQSAFQIQTAPFAPGFTGTHCVTGPDAFEWENGLLQCSQQAVGIRFDWTERRVFVVGTLVDIEGSFPDAHDAWLGAGPFP